jgi:predicted patatin/cPLA2 family phospholipase
LTGCREQVRRFCRSWLFSVGLLCISGCSSLERLPAVPQSETHQATFLNIPNARFVIDETPPTALIEELKGALQREITYNRSIGNRGPLPPANYLALSGGGDNGAFGAGLLVGWSERGTRPVFKAVTGVSTGALSAPFAFLGSEYDFALTNVYTKSDVGDIFTKRPLLAAVADDALTDTAPLHRLISSYVDDVLVEKIAREYDKGRLLMIGTTNLDAGRPVIWNIGAIARSGNPMAKEAISRILLASASIPGLFSPVMFDIELDGRKFQEMHGDGGASAQTFLYPPTISIRSASAAAARNRTAYIIRNGKIFEDWKETERKTLSIAGRAVSTLIGSSGVGDMYRIYGTTKRDGVAYNLALVEADFTEPYKGPFDREYMTKLFEYGRAKAGRGYPWRKGPPGFSEAQNRAVE